MFILFTRNIKESSHEHTSCSLENPCKKSRRKNKHLLVAAQAAVAWIWQSDRFEAATIKRQHRASERHAFNFISETVPIEKNFD